MRTNFTLCEEQNIPLSAENIALYGYSGPLINIPRNNLTQITLQGCKVLCGNGTDWYPWSKQSGTLTTWIFPVLGIILQGPYTSNAFWATVFALARWIGNPMASLAYTLWNIKVAAKSAHLVETSIHDDASLLDLADDTSDFGSIRDSFFLLSAMNQFTMPSHIRGNREAEGLRRMVLFSKDLRLVDQTTITGHAEPMMQTAPNAPNRRPDRDNAISNGLGGTSSALNLGPQLDLTTVRRELAADFRASRKRGAVAVYISMLWFLFSLAISVQGGFGLLGLNSEAHDLALGCLLSWLPVLILCSVVDRNPVSPEDIRLKLNRLIDHVRRSLLHAQVREEYLQTIQDPQKRDVMRPRMRAMANCSTINGFFEEFAGQGRYAAHPGFASGVPMLTVAGR